MNVGYKSARKERKEEKRKEKKRTKEEKEAKGMSPIALQRAERLCHKAVSKKASPLLPRVLEYLLYIHKQGSESTPPLSSFSFCHTMQRCASTKHLGI